MKFDLLTPPKGHRGRGQNEIAAARPMHVSNLHAKFG